MLIKIHESYRKIIAICDSELLGKKFEEGNKQLEINEFFNGEEKTKEEIKEIIEEMKLEDAIFNIVGENAIQLAISCNVINKDCILKIQGIPYAMALL